MATAMDKAVTRVTVNKWRISLSGAFKSESGRPLVVTLKDDMLVIREQGRRLKYGLPVASVYGWMVKQGAKL